MVKARVPHHCVVQQQGQGQVSADGAVSRGQFREYCNAPQGYEVVFRYAPGALRGAVLTAGNDAVLLKGSGEAVLSRSSGPPWIELTIVAQPAERGFDTDRLELAVIPRDAG